MTYHDEVSILNFNEKLLLVVFCLFVGFFYSPNIREPSSTCCMPLHVTSQVQEVPIDLVAAGYAALCDFFSGQSNKDPRLDPSYSRSFKQDGTDKLQKSSKLQRKRTADATGICPANTVRRCVSRKILQN